MSIITLARFKAQIGSDELIDADALGSLAAGTNEMLQDFIDAAEARAAAMLGKPLSDFDPLPADIKQATLMIAAHFYACREAVSIGQSGSELPHGAADLLRNYRVEVTGYVR